MGILGDDPFLEAPCAPSAASGPLTVREVTAHVKQLIERSELLREVEVVGEISNFTRHRSGHLYFSLKDESATLRCVCFRSAAGRLSFEPEDGQRVVAAGEVTVYEKGGQYQLLVRVMRPDGMGALAEALAKLRAKLEAEGLFDPSRKRPLPRFPRRIGLVTSPTGAAVRDMVTVLGRRYPLAELLVFPTVVQGEAAPASIMASMRQADRRGDVDVLIVGRGGGSIEDLWAFNDEGVARAIFASRTPVISAVGHETDWTIADLVADVRAPTPSGAAEIAVPDQRELTAALEAAGRRLARGLHSRAEASRARLAGLVARPGLRRPGQMLTEYALWVDEATQDLTDAARQRLERLALRLEVLGGKLDALGPPAVLARGYSITRRVADGAVVSAWTQVRAGEVVEIALHRGGLRATAEAVVPPAQEADP
ncbi:MAG: exodeoxyribonuclease VII large subunit [Armatimonadetes bacterium]|nr:exodeoxyribonuclease VII large subunit [Armatimonadota bacterium]